MQSGKQLFVLVGKLTTRQAVDPFLRRREKIAATALGRMAPSSRRSGAMAFTCGCATANGTEASGERSRIGESLARAP